MTATALPTRDRTGRFAVAAPIPTCAGCRYTLAESLAAAYYCPNPKCADYRQDVDTVPGANPGVLTAEMLEPPR